MWIFSKTGFVSLVQHKDDPSLLVVRARALEDLLAFVPERDIVENAGTDYRYRAVVHRHRVVAIIAQQIEKLDYTTHAKEEMTGDDDARYSAYLDVWAAMFDFQQGHYDKPEWDADFEFPSGGDEAAYQEWLKEKAA